MRPRVSIVLPTHNGASYLAQAIASCLEQSYRDVELIVVDDGSTDETPRILQAAAIRDERVIVVTNSANIGLPASLNEGFLRARGELLTWTSDDNYYRPNALATLVRALDEQPSADVAYSCHTVRWEETGHEERRQVEPPERLVEANVVFASFLYRRWLLEDIGAYDPELLGAEDYDFWLRAQLAGAKLSPVPEDLYVYRYHAGTLTSRRREQVLLSTQTCLKRSLGSAPGFPRLQRAAGYRQLADIAIERRDLRAFRAAFAQAFRLSPWLALARSRNRRHPSLNYIAFVFGFGLTDVIREGYGRLSGGASGTSAAHRPGPTA